MLSVASPLLQMYCVQKKRRKYWSTEPYLFWVCVFFCFISVRVGPQLFCGSLSVSDLFQVWCCKGGIWLEAAFKSEFISFTWVWFILIILEVKIDWQFFFYTLHSTTLHAYFLCNLMRSLLYKPSSRLYCHILLRFLYLYLLFLYFVGQSCNTFQNLVYVLVYFVCMCQKKLITNQCWVVPLGERRNVYHLFETDPDKQRRA